MKTLSLILTCYNEGNLIYKALESLKNQTDLNFETIIVCDYSDDSKTINICKKLQLSGYFVLFTESNMGLSYCRNLAIKNSTGEIILCLDADDTLPLDTIEIVKKEFENFFYLSFIFGIYTKIEVYNNFHIEYSKFDFLDRNNNINFELLLNNWNFLGNSPFLKEVWENVGGYSEEFSNTLQDIDFWLKVFEKNYSGKFIYSHIYNWYRYGNSMNDKIRSIDISRIRLRHFNFYLKYSKINEEKLVNDIFIQFYHFKDSSGNKLFLRKFIKLSAKNKLRFIYFLIQVSW